MDDNDDTTCWRELIAGARQEAGDEEGDLVFCTLDDQGLDKRFDGGYGCPEGAPFTAWTLDRVYFPREYDGSENVGSAPRNPCNVATRHQ